MSQTGPMLEQIWSGLGGGADLPGHVREIGEGSLGSVFAVSDFAAASTAAAGLAVAELIRAQGGPLPDVTVDRRLASMWFSKSIRPAGWSLPPQWDAVAGDYRARDGWIRLHTNAPHHRAAALKVLGVAEDRAEVGKAVAQWPAQDLEDAVVAAGGCAAKMRSLEEWAAHPQGQAVSAEPLMAVTTRSGTRKGWAAAPGRPLAGIRVLDLTRVLAGPVATRFLAGYGADVLRIDPPGWDEPAVLAEVALGKRRARLDLHDRRDRELFEDLLAPADILVHGYRSDALSALGYDAARLQQLSPEIIDVALDAYGWTGPWQARRGFDSLVQMSTGLAAEGMRVRQAEVPVPLPVQALDYGTGCLMAAAAVRALTLRLTSGEMSLARASLARTAAFVAAHRSADLAPLKPESEEDLALETEATHWGEAQRLQPPVTVAGCPMRWDLPAGPLGDSPPRFGTAA
ncbi:MAG: acyl-CoA transferase [Hyphomicrobiales bacterium]|nr:acyl-CoA transferase [Hyphomicrobiales bacterium]